MTDMPEEWNGTAVVVVGDREIPCSARLRVATGLISGTDIPMASWEGAVEISPELFTADPGLKAFLQSQQWQHVTLRLPDGREGLATLDGLHLDPAEHQLGHLFPAPELFLDGKAGPPFHAPVAAVSESAAANDGQAVVRLATQGFPHELGASLSVEAPDTGEQEAGSDVTIKDGTWLDWNGRLCRAVLTAAVADEDHVAVVEPWMWNAKVAGQTYEPDVAPRNEVVVLTDEEGLRRREVARKNALNGPVRPVRRGPADARERQAQRNPRSQRGR